ncbi:hypothetical protein B0H11DRAFT_1919798 [Mycena galericulata]|nr:hypothetical protein B0H11DRAFT_1919798 [Mycena galericulata]
MSALGIEASGCSTFTNLPTHNNSRTALNQTRSESALQSSTINFNLGCNSHINEQTRKHHRPAGRSDGPSRTPNSLMPDLQEHEIHPETSTWPTLPTEIWIQILYTYCGGFNLHPYYYNCRRDALRRLNSEWKRLIDADGLFWCRVVINAGVTVASLRGHVTHIHGRRMDVSIDLNHLLAYSQCGVDHPRYKHTQRLLSTLAPTSHLWRHVTITSNCVKFMRLVTDVLLQPSQGRSFQHFALRVIPDATEETVHDLFSTPPVVLNSNTPRLLHLRLVSATVSWTSVNIFSSLTILEIVNIAKARWPSQTELLCILAAANSLITLVIKNCGASPSRYGDKSQKFTLPHLVALDLHRSVGMNSVIRVLGQASTPSLRRLTVRGFDGPDVRLLERGLQNFGKIQQLRIRGSICSQYLPEDISSVLGSLPDLLLLDVNCDAATFLSVLTTNIQHGTKLITLSITDVPLPVLHAYVMSKPADMSSKLHVLHITDEEDNNGRKAHMLTETRSRLANLQLCPRSL